MASPVTDTKDVPKPFEGYAPASQQPPLLSYLTLTGVFLSLFGGALWRAKRGRRLPERVPTGDLLTIGVATHKLSRLVAKDKVTSPLRAPFTEFEEKGGPAELEERARGTGLRKAVGDLLICPYCIGLWIAGGFSISLLFAPRLTRLLAALFSALAISDFLQIAYKAAEKKGLG